MMKASLMNKARVFLSLSLVIVSLIWFKDQFVGEYLFYASVGILIVSLVSLFTNKLDKAFSFNGTSKLDDIMSILMVFIFLAIGWAEKIMIVG